MGAVAVIRLKGKFSISPKVEYTLQSLNLNRLYTCTVVPKSESYAGMLFVCKDVVTFGDVSKDTIFLLLLKRGKTIDGKPLSEVKSPEEISSIASQVAEGKKLSDFGISPVFFLSPPKGGFDSKKLSYPLGQAGKNPEIESLIARMV